MKRDKLLQLRAMIVKAAISLNDEDALSAVELFPLWQTDKAYAVDERIRYGEKLYKCVQAHTSQAGWTPDVTPALWTEVSVDEWPEWRQPTGAQDAYNKGDKVTFEGKHYISLIDANVYSPAVYPAGWEEQI